MKLRSRSIIVTLVVLATLFWIIPRTAKRASIQEHSNKFKLSSSYSSGVLKEYGWVGPNFYSNGDKVDITVNKIESDLTHFNYGYYDLHFTCPPSESAHPLHLTLNDIFQGNKKWESDYKLSFGKDEDCLRLCDRRTYAEGKKQAYDLIKKQYVVQWLADDDLPGATTYISTKDQKKYYSSGFPLGFEDPDTGKVYINNHVMLVIRYNTVDINKYTIVGFEVYPKSVSDYHCPGASKNYEYYEINPENEDIELIPFTYSVYWREELKVDWKHRWNFFINSGELKESTSNQFHWIALGNGLLVTIALLIIVLTILNKQESDSSLISQLAGEWLHARVPLFLQLNLFVSMGIHFLFTTFGTLIISCSLNQFHNIRNSVLTFALFFFISGGFSSSFVGVVLEGQSSKNRLRNSVLYGSTLPGITLFVISLLNFILKNDKSTNSLPFGTLLLLFTIYFVICIPISILGGKMANKFVCSKPNNQLLSSFQYNEISKQDLRPLYVNKAKLPIIVKNPIAITISFGLIPFALIYVELLFAYKSLWLQKTTLYYLYGFLLGSIIIVSSSICLLAIMGCFIHLNYGNDSLYSKWDNFAGRVLEACHSWRWKAFCMGGAVAWYLEAYSIFYLIFVAKYRDASSIILFICYSTFFNGLCWCAFGSLSYLSSLWFIAKMNEYNKAK